MDERTEELEIRTAQRGARAGLLRMQVPKNRAKGTWRGMTVLQLLAKAQEEIGEAIAAYAFDEGDIRLEEEIGDAIAALCQAYDVQTLGRIVGESKLRVGVDDLPPLDISNTWKGDCCCGDHDDSDACCPGYCVIAIGDETTVIARCDECAILPDDVAACVAHRERLTREQVLARMSGPTPVCSGSGA